MFARVARYASILAPYTTCFVLSRVLADVVRVQRQWSRTGVVDLGSESKVPRFCSTLFRQGADMCNERMDLSSPSNNCLVVVITIMHSVCNQEAQAA